VNVISLVIFDWAGTTVDFGSCAPAAAFTQVFARHGVAVSDGASRAPMGANKRDHLIAMLKNPEVAAAWKTTHGRDWNDHDIDTMYEEFIPVQLQAIEKHADLVPGLVEVVREIRELGIRIGGTTGYFRQAADSILNLASKSGFAPDVNICADDVPEGRPAPWMIYRVMERLKIYPASNVVNVGDTIADIKSGVAAGCWSVGVCDSSSVTGLSVEQYRKLSSNEQQSRLDATARTFFDAGCHAVLNSMKELPALINTLNQLPSRTPCRLKDWRQAVR
jgi:phosphonoacetaldehyde hydrolase